MPKDPSERSIHNFPTSLEIRHAFGANENYGDVTLDVEDYGDTFGVYMDRCTGRDRDNYDSSDTAEIKLNVEEAREVHLALQAWLEKHA